MRSDNSKKKKIKEQSKEVKRNEKRARIAKSTEEKVLFYVIFRNHHSQAVNLFWKDIHGKEMFVKAVQASESHPQTTYLTHVWVARNRETDKLLYFANKLMKDIIFKGEEYGAQKVNDILKISIVAD